jgi:hypothetical protein
LYSMYFFNGPKNRDTNQARITIILIIRSNYPRTPNRQNRQIGLLDQIAFLRRITIMFIIRNYPRTREIGKLVMLKVTQ